MAMKVTFKRDPLFEDVKKFVQQEKFTSGSRIQRKFSLGFNRAARIVDEMEAKGIVGPSEGSKPRQVLIPPEKDDDQ